MWQRQRLALCTNKLLLLSRFSRVRLCATPQTRAHQAPPSLEFPRQEHWSGLPFPSPMQQARRRQRFSNHQRPGRVKAGFRGNVTLLTPWLWISGLQNFETVTFCCGRPQRLWSFIRQPEKTNAGGWRLFTFTEPLAPSCPAPMPEVLVEPPEKF